MTNPPVHWHEGMFLRPQHFQSAQRNWSSLIARNSKWDHHYNWGLRSVDLDPDALANYRCAVRSLEARLRDGSLVSVSEDEPLAPLNLRRAFEESNSITVFLGLPSFQLGRVNATTTAPPATRSASAGNYSGAAAQARFIAETLELEDENSGQNPQTIPVRRLNLRLMLSTDAMTGYEVIPLARLEKSPRAEATPEVDSSFFPPLLACDAWRPLAGGVLQTLFDRIGKKVGLLADQVTSRGISFDASSQGDAQTFNQLRELNQAYTTLGVLAFAQGIHPYEAYSELCRLVGQLAIFGKDRRPPDLPVYDHDDLARCFFEVRRHIDGLLDVFVEPEYRERSFLGAGLRMQASLEPAWLEPNWQMYLGVKSPLEPDETVKILTKPGLLDMKIGSSGRVDEIYRQGAAGLRFMHVAQPPRSLPMQQGQVYFQVLREAKESEWQHVAKSLTLAIRINENHVAGNIEGQRVLTVRHGGGTAPLQFTLFLLSTS